MGDAQAAAVCSNTPGDGDWIACEKASTSNDDIEIDVDGVAISTTAASTPGIKAEHAGGTSTDSGDITIDVTGTATKNTISTTNSSADGILGKHTGTGDLDIDVTGVGITTSGQHASGVQGEHTGTGDIDITIQGRTTGGTTTASTITTTGQDAEGIHVDHTGTGDVTITLDDTEISTTTIPTDDSAYGIDAEHTGEGHLTVDLNSGVTIDTQQSLGVRLRHESSSTTADKDITLTADDITVNVGKASDASNGIHGIYAEQESRNGDISITVDDTDITTHVNEAVAIYGWKKLKTGDSLSNTSGDVRITVSGGSTITTSGTTAVGIKADNDVAGNVIVDVRDSTLNAAGGGIDISSYDDIDVDVTGSSITTTKDSSRGIFADGENNNVGGNENMDIDLTDTNISTSGVGSHGIRTRYQNNRTGNLDITINGGTITTTGRNAFGIYGKAEGNQGSSGDSPVSIDLDNVAIRTESATTGGSFNDTFSVGVYGSTAGYQDMNIDVQGGSILTKGVFSYGIYGEHYGVDANCTSFCGNVSITTGGGHSVTTEGANGHGIVAYHRSSYGREISVTVGGPVTVKGAGAQGVRIGRIDSDGKVERAASLDGSDLRKQTVTVNGPVTAAGEGVFMAGGGTVIIGPQGSIRSDKGIAILAEGLDPDFPTLVKTKLRVELNLEGRRVSQVLGDDWILNDGNEGQTTIAVNGTVLHNGATGVTEETVANGAYNVSMVAGGRKVTDRTNADPAMWTVSDRAEDVIAGRDFSAADFSEKRKYVPPPPPPPPPPEPDPPAVDGATLGQLVGGALANALNGVVLAPPSEQETPASPSSSPFIEVYAPRAAVYEALPAALLGLNDAGQGTGSPFPQGTFTFARTLEDHDGLRPADSTVGQRHALGYGGAQFGKRLQLGDTLGASVALHRVWSTVDVEAGTGGGEISVEATGLILDGAWNGPEGLYAKAGLSMTHYRLGTWSEDRDVGMLAGGIGARGSLARIEAGREVSLGGGLHVTPRIWFKRSALSVDGFTDAVGSRVSIPGTARMTGGVGMAARAERRAGSGTLSLRGSVDLAHVLDGRAAVTEVSGARLTSQAEDTELRLALSGVYRQGRFSLAAEASLNGSDPGDARGTVGLRLSASF